MISWIQPTNVGDLHMMQVASLGDPAHRIDIARAWRDALNLADYRGLEWSMVYQRPGYIVGHTPGLRADQMPDFAAPDFDAPEWDGAIEEAAAHCGITTEF